MEPMVTLQPTHAFSARISLMKANAYLLVLLVPMYMWLMATASAVIVPMPIETAMIVTTLS